MNKTTATIGVIIAIVVIAGLVYYSYHSGSQTAYTATPTTVTTTDNTTQTTNNQAQPGLPMVTTNSGVTPSDTAAVVNGQVTPNGVFTNYWYEYGTTASLGSKTANQMVGSGFASLPAPGYITGLTKDTTYYFRLDAQNQYGTISGSTYTFQTTHGNPAPVGSAPRSITVAANGISATTVNLNGQVNPNQAPTQYWFEYGPTVDLGNTTALVSVGDGSVLVSAGTSLTDLNPGTTYYFRLNAENQFGTVNGTILNFKTAGSHVVLAPVVTTQVAYPVATTTATLRGTVNPNGAQTTYWFEYSTDSLLGSVLLKTTPQKLAGAGSSTVSVVANISNLQSGTTYYYRTVGQNSAGTVRGDNQTFTTKQKLLTP